MVEGYPPAVMPRLARWSPALLGPMVRAVPLGTGSRVDERERAECRGPSGREHLVRLHELDGAERQRRPTPSALGSEDRDEAAVGRGRPANDGRVEQSADRPSPGTPVVAHAPPSLQ